MPSIARAHYAPDENALPAPVRGGELAAQDIEWALSRMDGVIDVSEEDLLEIYRLAKESAGRRKP